MRRINFLSTCHRIDEITNHCKYCIFSTKIRCKIYKPQKQNKCPTVKEENSLCTSDYCRSIQYKGCEKCILLHKHKTTRTSKFNFLRVKPNRNLIRLILIRILMIKNNILYTITM